MKLIHLLLTLFLLAGLEQLGQAAQRPNIIIVLVDDLGFSDIGCYGGEIQTPHLDRLAASGLRFTQFYNCAKCETTRATLLSGRYHHEVGIRKLNNCVTIAEAMKEAGYTTLMAGKWHMEGNPLDRGFDRFFGHLSGACNYFTGDNTFRINREPFKVPDQGFYTTDANTDYALRFLEEADRDKPFFLYLAYNAPHYPLQAPKGDVMKYRGKYRMGWDQLRQQRYSRIKKMGLLAKDYPLAPRPDDVPAWETLTEAEKDREDLMMATFAGMVDRVDQNIGRLIAQLKKMGAYEDTLLLFFSDNGACPFQRTKKTTIDQGLMPWDPNSYWTYDKGWAHACNTPFREYKQNQHEGGIATPFIAHWPKGVSQPGSITRQAGHLVDIMATCLDLAGATYPPTRKGESFGPARGRSLTPILRGNSDSNPDFIHFTFYGKNNALRQGDWKLVNKNWEEWELYNMAADRTELRNLADAQPEKLTEMKRFWEQIAHETNVPKKKKNRPAFNKK